MNWSPMSALPEKVFLYPGQLASAGKETVISTLLGSCVAVALFDPVKKVGGLNHYLLPEVPPNEKASGRYGDFAIRKLVHDLEKLGASVSRLQAKVYGGGNVLNENSFGESIGSSNIILAYQLLGELGIAIVEENVGGTVGRKIAMNTTTFAVDHKLNERAAS